MAATVSPSRLQLDSELDSPEPSIYDEDDGEQWDTTGYACLRFPDTDYFLQEKSIIIGRDQDLQERLAHCATLCVNGKTVPCANASSSSISGSSEESESECSGVVASDELVQASQSGGVLGMHARADIVPTTRYGDVDEAFLPIHPPLDRSGKFQFNSISKNHVRISLENDEEWRVKALGRNGFFLNDVFIPKGIDKALKNDSKLQIANLIFTFITEGDYESDSETEDSSGGDSAGQESHTATGTNADGRKKVKSQHVEDSKTKPSKTNKNAKAKVESGNGSSRKRTEQDTRELLNEGEVPQKKRGPGRPPANGIMSKREMRERKKAQEQAGLAEGEPAAAVDSVDTSHGATSGDAVKVKKSSKKRKRADSSIDGKKIADTETVEKEKQKSESPKPPPPQKSDFTPEQLLPPKNRTYLAIIYEILADKKPKALSLQEIYEAVKDRYPFYRFIVESNGWESSIRHTVAQQKFFNKISKGEKDGKGHRYTINTDNPPPQAKSRNAIPQPPQPATYRPPGLVMPPGGYRPGQPPYFAPPPGHMHYTLPPGMYANNLNGPPAMPGQRPAYPSSYTPQNVGSVPGPPRPPVHLQNGAQNNLPTRIPTQSPGMPQPNGLNHPSNALPNRPSTEQQRNPNAPGANGALPAQSTSSTSATHSSPVSGQQASHNPGNGAMTTGQANGQARQASSKPLPATANGVPAGAPSQATAATISNHVTSSTANGISLANVHAHPPHTNQQHLPPHEATKSSTRTPQVTKEAAPKTHMELFFTGRRPSFFEKTKRTFSKQDDQVACEKAAVWMMQNTKKLEEYWRNKEAKDPHPDAPVESKKVNSFVKILSSVLRTDHEETMRKWRSSHVEGLDESSRARDES